MNANFANKKAHQIKIEIGDFPNFYRFPDAEDFEGKIRLMSLIEMEHIRDDWFVGGH
jgi:hypothetical protein